MAEDIFKALKNLADSYEVKRGYGSRLLESEARKGVDLTPVLSNVKNFLYDYDSTVSRNVALALGHHYINKSEWDEVKRFIELKADSASTNIKSGVLSAITHAAYDIKSDFLSAIAHAAYKRVDISPVLNALEWNLGEHDVVLIDRATQSIVYYKAMKGEWDYVISLMKRGDDNVGPCACKAVGNLVSKLDIAPTIPTLKSLLDSEECVSFMSANALTRYYLRYGKWDEVEKLLFNKKFDIAEGAEQVFISNFYTLIQELQKKPYISTLDQIKHMTGIVMRLYGKRDRTSKIKALADLTAYIRDKMNSVDKDKKFPAKRQKVKASAPVRQLKRFS